MPTDKMFKTLEQRGHEQTIKNLHCHKAKVVQILGINQLDELFHVFI